MDYINKIACDVVMKGWCDQLGKNPKNYLFVAVLSLFLNYLAPVLIYFSLIMFTDRDSIFGPVVTLLSPVLPGIMTIYLSSVSVVAIVLTIILLVIDVFYLIYMARQLGVLVIIPVAFEIARIAIILFLPSWMWLAVILSVLPIMTFAVILHFVLYMLSRGVVMKQL